jgi:hypothetical protein
MKNGACTGVLMLALVAGSTSALAGALPFTVVALTARDTAVGPGMGAGITFTALDQQQPAINAAGQVIFRATESSTNSQGVWTFGGSSSTNIALAGTAMPGGGTYTAGSTGIFNAFSLTNSGEWAFRMGGSTGAFATSGGTPTRVALTGDVAPGTGGATYGALLTSAPRFSSDTGRVAFFSNLTAGTGSPVVVATGANANSLGLWTGTPGSQSLALRRDDALFSLDAGGAVRVNSLNNLSLAINGGGRYVLSTTLQGTVTTGTAAGNDAAILSNRSGSLEVIARRGAAAPDATGAPSATDLYRDIPTGAMGFNNAGRIAFATTLRNAAGVQTATGALFTDTVGGTLKMHARIGAPMPTVYSPAGAPLAEFGGVNWGGAWSNLTINAADKAVFFASGLTNTGAANNTGAILTMDSSGTFTKVARAGDIAIINGAPLGGHALFQSNFSNITMNASGQIAFSALLSGAGIAGGPGGNNSAMFGWDPSNGYCLIARTSDPFQVAPGDVRTIASLGGLVSSGGQDGAARSLNDSGVLAFQLSFTDGSSGIFTTTIPAPGTIGMLGLAGLIAARRRRA